MFVDYLLSNLHLIKDTSPCYVQGIRSLLGAKGRLISVSDVEETVGVLSLLVDLAHEGITFEKVSAVHEEVEGTSLWELDSLSDDVVEVVGREVVWNKVPDR